MSYGYRERPAVGGTLATLLPKSRIGEPLAATERRTARQIKEETLVATFTPMAFGTLTGTNGGVPAVWATVRGAATADSISTSVLQPGIDTGGAGADWDAIARAFLYYDVSDTLRIQSEIVRASLRLHVLNGTIVRDFAGSVDIVPFTGSTPPAVADFDQFGTTNLTLAPTLETLEDYEGNYRSFVLNDDGRGYISTAGPTLFGLRIAADTDDAEPAWAASDTDQAGFDLDAYPPLLIVEFVY